VIDLDELGAIAGPVTVVDSTFGTPVLQQPLQHGVDLVIHSATKGIAGHNDALARALDEMLGRPLAPPVVSPSVKALGHTPTRVTSQTKKTRGEKRHGNKRAHKIKQIQ
jgi:hypothetical protein